MEENVSFFDNEKVESSEQLIMNSSAGGQIEVVQMSFVGPELTEVQQVINALVGVLSNNNEYKEIKNEVKELESQILSFIAAGLLILASATVNLASVWVFSYQPKTPKCLTEKSR